MFDLDKWQEIWNTIIATPVRSAMTGFGVFWGIFMLVILVGAGNSMRVGVMKNMEGFASNSCFFFANVTNEPFKGFRKGRYWSIKNNDIELIKNKATALEDISPMLFGKSSAKNVVLGRKSASASIIGVNTGHFRIQSLKALEGRLFNELDIKELSKVTLIGKTISENLFNNESPIGKYIRINGIYFRVIGVVESGSKAQIGGNTKTSVLLPFTTMQRAFNMGENVNFLGATAKDGIKVSLLQDQITSILQANHDIAPNDTKAIRSFNVELEFLAFKNLFLGMDIIIWIVGIGSLLSGIIGVTNIMLIAIKERTREIGVRRALGAKPSMIVSQIMSESFVLTFISGFLGLFVGVIVLELVGMIMGTDISDETFFAKPFISFWIAVGSIFILVLAGLLAGLIPASRALSVKAIDAIRDE